MATTLSKPAAPAASATNRTVSATTANRNAPVRAFLFDKSNYRWMLIGIGLILLGFFLMAGGKSDNPHVFNDAEVYSFRRITLAPLVMIAGFIIEVYAILRKPTQ
jgi:hypothetical protein